MNHSFVSDYFALGVIAYELMTGKVIFNWYSDPITEGHAIRLGI